MIKRAIRTSSLLGLVAAMILSVQTVNAQNAGDNAGAGATVPTAQGEACGGRGFGGHH